MTYRLFVTREATKDANEGYEWYESRQRGLGKRFLDELDDCYLRILHSPFQFRNDQNRHVAVVKKFPYKIVFGVHGDNVIIFAIYHDKRDPTKLIDRLSEDD